MQIIYLVEIQDKWSKILYKWRTTDYLTRHSCISFLSSRSWTDNDVGRRIL
jgi:hypothetical protein